MSSASCRVDLHLYSRHSDRSADWALRRLDFPASSSSPRTLYDMLREAGMQFVTLTDHHTIDGCLEIAGLPGVFVSEEVSTCFPEDQCRVHLLLWNITEAQHRSIHELRENIYELQAYLAAQGIAHAVAHPLVSVNEKLTPLHFRKLILLFRHFEGINGLRHQLYSDAARFCLSGLGPEDIERFANETGIAPTHDEPWKKAFVGGSDDHGAIFVARACTETPGAATVGEFLNHVREGRCGAIGRGGTPLALAHTVYSVGFDYARERLSSKSGHTPELLEKIFSRFMEGRNPTEFTLSEKLGFLVNGFATGKIFEIAKVGNSSLWKELAGYFSKPEVKAALAREIEGIAEPERRAFLMTNLIANQLSFRFFSQFVSQLSAGKFLECIQFFSPLIPIGVLLAPYFLAFRMPGRNHLRNFTGELCGDVPDFLRNRKRAWLTDTLEDVNGVATTIRKMVAAGVEQGHDLVVLTSRAAVAINDIPIHNFAPIGEFELPEYELQSLSFPPVLEMIDYLEREGFTEVILSTPGPVGLVGLLAAKVLGLPVVGIYHTDFPQYVRILTDDSLMETLTWNFMHWFYCQMDHVYVNSEDYRKSWIARGISAERLSILPRGLDAELFNPAKREGDFWSARGLREGELAMLYVGRISKEKNLDVLTAALRKKTLKGIPVRPVFVGDGPYRKELGKLLPDAIFTGYLTGLELARAYASADFFAFPSTTDTFGNVVVEAQASGLPTIVTDVGGPRDLVEDGVDGLIIRALDVEAMAGAIRKLAQDAELRAEMGTAGRRKVESRDWSSAFEAFWSSSPE